MNRVPKNLKLLSFQQDDPIYSHHTYAFIDARKRPWKARGQFTLLQKHDIQERFNWFLDSIRKNLGLTPKDGVIFLRMGKQYYIKTIRFGRRGNVNQTSVFRVEDPGTIRSIDFFEGKPKILQNEFESQSLELREKVRDLDAKRFAESERLLERIRREIEKRKKRLT